jgi:hypothetical protein
MARVEAPWLAVGSSTERKGRWERERERWGAMGRGRAARGGAMGNRPAAPLSSGFCT